MPAGAPQKVTRLTALTSPRDHHKPPASPRSPNKPPNRRLSAVPEIEAAQNGSETAAIAKAPFAGWRCLTSPQTAIDPEQCEPFAFLEITIERGFCLEPADVNTSDPYCKLELNGVPTGHVTQVKQATLAPQWDETFQLPVYHPKSVVSIMCFDSDFGTNLGELDLLGLDDDFLGWLDFPVSKMPHNAKMRGWFELNHCAYFIDNLIGRKRKVMSEKKPQWSQNNKSRPSAGFLLLSFTLKVKGKKDEYFAMMLPRPHKGHGLPTLDMELIVSHYNDVKNHTSVLSALWNFFYREFPTYPVCFTLAAVFLIWHPSFILPFTTFASACLFWRSWLAEIRGRTNRKARFMRVALKSAKKAAKEMYALFAYGEFMISRKHKKLLAGKGEPLLAKGDTKDDGSSTMHVSRRSSMGSRRESAGRRASLQPSFLAAATTNTSVAIKVPEPKAQAKVTQKQVPVSVEGKASSVELGSSASLLENDGAELAQMLSKIQPFLSGENKMDMRKLQAALSFLAARLMAIDIFLEEDSKLFIAAVTFTMLFSLLLVLRVWSLNKIIVKMLLTSVVCVRWPKDTMIWRFGRGTYFFMRERALRRRLHFNIALQKQQDGTYRVHGHLCRHLSSLRMGRLIRCCFYRSFKEALNLNARHAHNVVKFSYTEPTWCYGCGRFLWGLTHQGWQCRWCQRNFCKSCIGLATDKLGPQSCDAEVDPNFEPNTEETEAASEASKASSVSSLSRAHSAMSLWPSQHASNRYI